MAETQTFRDRLNATTDRDIRERLLRQRRNFLLEIEHDPTKSTDWSKEKWSAELAFVEEELTKPITPVVNR
jgi:hypothetical protein